ncbi:hypothetical protein [Luteibacter sp. ME-Dv--P-043b]|uniref:hypothetical protein n=1 Tax=Luteibacter sp. ME-Dv--P-043b TaxID=3040291 RepID=UPI0025524030|nr:hypothetical protein [Luteibacter sp. ME-Dv--P-043b]
MPLKFPPAHPFNPLPALRLCIAVGTTPDAVGAIFEWIWAHGRAADTPEAIQPLATSPGIGDVGIAHSAPDVKAGLQANFEQAICDQVYGVSDAGYWHRAVLGCRCARVCDGLPRSSLAVR